MRWNGALRMYQAIAIQVNPSGKGRGSEPSRFNTAMKCQPCLSPFILLQNKNRSGEICFHKQQTTSFLAADANDGNERTS